MELLPDGGSMNASSAPIWRTTQPWAHKSVTGDSAPSACSGYPAGSPAAAWRGLEVEPCDSWASSGGFGKARSQSSAAAACRLNEIQNAGPKLDLNSAEPLRTERYATAHGQTIRVVANS